MRQLDRHERWCLEDGSVSIAVSRVIENGVARSKFAMAYLAGLILAYVAGSV